MDMQKWNVFSEVLKMLTLNGNKTIYCLYVKLAISRSYLNTIWNAERNIYFLPFSRRTNTL